MATSSYMHVLGRLLGYAEIELSEVVALLLSKL